MKQPRQNTGNHPDQLAELVSHAAALAAFANDVLRYLWDGDGLDGGDIQHLAEKRGLIQQVAFDPKRHDDHLGVGAYAGDPWYVQEPWIMQLAKADAPAPDAEPEAQPLQP